MEKLSPVITVELDIYSMILAPSTQSTVNGMVHNEGKDAVKNIEFDLVSSTNNECNSVDLINSLAVEESINIEFTVTVPEDAEYSPPYDEDILQVELLIENQCVISTNTIAFENTVAIFPKISVQVSQMQH